VRLSNDEGTLLKGELIEKGSIESY
jgi:hypothetical protein